MTEFWTFAVTRDDLFATTLLTADLPDLADDEVLLKVDRVGLTTNNVTYAMLGATTFRYWDFFPTQADLGVVPVWGFADVVAANVAGIEVGSRVYGYLPTASHLIVKPDRVDDRGFTDMSTHRAELPSPYNAYALTATDQSYTASDEDLHILFRPLFWTAFMLADQAVEEDFYDAAQIVLSSASSKTAYCTASMLKDQGRDIVGLTSARNVLFTESLGCYDAVYSYDEVAQLADMPTAYVDFAGSSATLTALRQTLGRRLVREVIVGVTHQEMAGPDALNNPATTVFFAPDQMRKRTADWGRNGLDERFADAWSEFIPRAREWVDVVVGQGPDALRAAWLEVLAGTSPPRTGHVLAL
jgi:NADPH:quinone reductase-like Zn-dependent oxidoreductase